MNFYLFNFTRKLKMIPFVTSLYFYSLLLKSRISIFIWIFLVLYSFKLIFFKLIFLYSSITKNFFIRFNNLWILFLWRTFIMMIMTILWVKLASRRLLINRIQTWIQFLFYMILIMMFRWSICIPFAPGNFSQWNYLFL